MSYDNNNISNKSKVFALRCIRLYKYLMDNFNEFVLSKQLVRSGTSIGANVKEAQRAQSTPDFISKLNIALKEANETEYWLELLYESEYIDSIEFKSMHDDCVELLKILTAIIKSTISNQKSKSATK